MLYLLRTFLMAAYSTNDADAFEVADLVRRTSGANRIDMVDQQEVGEDEQAEPGTMGEVEGVGESFKQLSKLLEGPLGAEVLGSVDYPALQKKILAVVDQVLQKDVLVFEDKLIVDNALNLWVGCLLHKSGLVKAFVESKDQEVNAEHLILGGLLRCPYETVREEFKASLGALCHKSAGSEVSPGFGTREFTLKLLSQNFSLISKYSCQQFLELFSELLDQHYTKSKDGDARQRQQVIDPEALLSSVID